MSNLKEKSQELHARREELFRMTQNPGNITGSQAEEIRRRNQEIKSLCDEVTRLRDMEHIATDNARELRALGQTVRTVPFSGAQGTGESGEAWKNQGMDTRTLGERFVESDAFRMRNGDTSMSPIVTDLPGISVKSLSALKATMTTAAGWAPFVPRSPRVIESATRRPVIADLIPQEDTLVPGFKYMEETTFTNNAASVGEGEEKPESTLQLTERTVTMAKIATTLPVTDEQLDDVPQIRSYIDNRLTLQVELAEESGLLNYVNLDDGFDGFMTKSGVQTHAKGSDPIPTAVFKAMTKVRWTGYAEPTGIIMHPNDWQDIVTLQETTGGYIWTLPGAPNGAPEPRLWGLPVVVTNAMAENTALLGDFRMFSQIMRRMGIRIDIGYSNDDWVKNIQRIRAEERLALLIYRASAFVKLTGV